MMRKTLLRVQIYNQDRHYTFIKRKVERLFRELKREVEGSEWDDKDVFSINKEYTLFKKG